MNESTRQLPPPPPPPAVFSLVCISCRRNFALDVQSYARHVTTFECQRSKWNPRRLRVEAPVFEPRQSSDNCNQALLCMEQYIIESILE